MVSIFLVILKLRLTLLVSLLVVRELIESGADRALAESFWTVAAIGQHWICILTSFCISVLLILINIKILIWEGIIIWILVSHLMPNYVIIHNHAWLFWLLIIEVCLVFVWNFRYLRILLLFLSMSEIFIVTNRLLSRFSTLTMFTKCLFRIS